jgi:hypothetical protein
MATLRMLVRKLMAVPMKFDPSDYHLAMSEESRTPARWRWEICRRSRPMGIRVWSGGYVSKLAAEFAGKRELDEFLKAAAEEDRRQDHPAKPHPRTVP